MASLCLGAFFLTHSNGANGVEEEGAFTPLSGWRFLTRLDHWVEGYSNENPNSYYLEYSSACAQLLVQTLLCLLVLHVFKPRVACGSLVLLSSQKCEYIWVCGNSGRDLNLAGGCRSPLDVDEIEMLGRLGPSIWSLSGLRVWPYVVSLECCIRPFPK